MNSMILAMGLCYGGSAQVIAGIFEFTKGNMFPMVAFMSYGFFWISLVVLLVFPKLGYAADPITCQWPSTYSFGECSPS